MNKGQAVFRTYTTLGRCLSALPEPVALGVANVVGDVLFRVRDEHRRMVSNNLRRVLGADADDPDDAVILDRWARRSFRAYARYWVEGARLGRTSPVEVEQRTLVRGLEYLVDGMAAGKGVIMALPHVGSWEYRGGISGHAGPADDLGGRTDRAARAVRVLRRAAGGHGADHRPAGLVVGGRGDRPRCAGAAWSVC